MRLDPGHRLDHFEILSAIGRGGMGEVYKARDTRLDRLVAIKVSEASFSERFEREARAIAALNHPNVCTLHDVGPKYLVMEYVDGESPRGPLSLERVLPIAAQIAAALEAAHARGLVHRDLKPGNILVKPDGTVKVLDFGLARMMQTPSFNPDDPTAQAPLTEAGIVMGTPAYMAPEQAEGKPADKRADIWAFGVILYELLSGQRLFKADSGPSTLAQVLTKDPDFSLVPPETHRLLRRCLERDPGRRLRDVGDALPLVDMTVPTGLITGRASPPSRLPWVIAAAVFALAALGLGILHFREAPAAPHTSVRFRIPYPEGQTPSAAGGFSLSPNGKVLIFTTGPAGLSRTWVQELDSLEPRLLPVGVGVGFWSYDSRSILFANDGKLKKADLSGGGPQTLCASPGQIIGGTSSRDHILLGALGAPGIMKLPAEGGTPVPVTVVDLSKERNHLMPFFLPDGRHFLYLKNSAASESSGIYLGSLDLPATEQPAERLIETGIGASFIPGPEGNGSILFLRDTVLLAQEFDLRALKLRGEPRVLARGVGSIRAIPFFAASTSGNLVYRTAPTETSQLTWLDRRGQVVAKVGEPLPPSHAPRLNPAGTHFVIDLWDAADRTNDVWLYSLSPYRAMRLTRGPVANEYPLWSADGSRVVYTTTRSGSRQLYGVAVDGDGRPAPLVESPGDKVALDWSPEGYLLYRVQGAQASADLWVLPPEGKAFPFVEDPGNEGVGAFSPDGKWVAYISDESGANEMYLRAFRPDRASSGAAAGPRIPLRADRAGSPHWGASGREILYMSGQGDIMALPIRLGPTVETGLAVKLFHGPTTFNWDHTSDGQRFLFAIPIEQKEVVPFTVVVNWRASETSEAARN